MKVARKTNSTNFENRQFLSSDCSLSVVLEKISGRWKMQVLYSISYGDSSFSLIKRRLSGISDRMLGLRLEALVEEGLIKKSTAQVGNPYSITARGKKLIRVLEALVDWEVQA